MSGLARASMFIGAGTIVSRLTGFLRAMVLVAAIGSVESRAADAFGTANQLPNNIYAIISTGLLTAVLVPQIVKASRHTDGGQAFVSKVFTLGAVVLLALTALATLAAPWLVRLYAPDYSPDQLALTTAFAYWCLPQILFYGLYALIGEALNARRVYGPFTWAPIVNNLVAIAGLIGFVVLFGGPVTRAEGWTSRMVALLAGTATLGIVVQAAILVLFWKRSGLHVRPDFRWRGVGFGHMGKLAGWTFLMVVAGQVAGIVQSRVLSPASGEGPAAAAAANAWLLFMLPYSIIVLSIGTPYFTQLSEHAAAGRDEAVRGDIDRSVRVLGLFVVIATFALAAAAVPASRIFTNSPEQAVQASWVLIAYLVGLIPLAVLFVIQRTFYAYNDTRTPFLFTLLQCVVVVGSALIAQALLPTGMLAAGVALGQSLASIVQAVLATWLLRRRLGTIHTGSWLRALGRFVLAAIPAAAAGGATFLLFGGPSGWTASSQLLAALGAALIGIVSTLVYLGLLAIAQAPELVPAAHFARRLPPRR